MEKIKNKFLEFFSTPKKAVISTLVIVATVAVAGTGAVFASVYWDMNEDRVENAVVETITGESGTDSGSNSSDAGDSGSDTGDVPDDGATDPADEGTAVDSAESEAQKEAEDAAGNDSDTAATTEEDIAAAAEKRQNISAEEAEDIALSDAGFSRDQVNHLFSHYEMDDGFYQYEVQFFKGDMEYEYSIGASDGEIYEVDTDYIYD